MPKSWIKKKKEEEEFSKPKLEKLKLLKSKISADFSVNKFVFSYKTSKQFHSDIHKRKCLSFNIQHISREVNCRRAAEMRFSFLFFFLMLLDMIIKIIYLKLHCRLKARQMPQLKVQSKRFFFFFLKTNFCLLAFHSHKT